MKTADYANTPYGGKNPMRRHFCITLWRDADGERISAKHGVLDLEQWLTSITDTARLTNAHYLAWGLEDGRLEQQGEKAAENDVLGSEEDGQAALHLHVYIELERTARWTTVRNKFQRAFKGAHVECRRGWRTTAREYALGYRRGVEKPSAITCGEWGDWRPESADQLPDDLAAAAADLIMEGGTPKQAAKKWPRWFLRHGGGVVRLWQTLHRRRWVP